MRDGASFRRREVSSRKSTCFVRLRWSLRRKSAICSQRREETKQIQQVSTTSTTTFKLNHIYVFTYTPVVFSSLYVVI